MSSTREETDRAGGARRRLLERLVSARKLVRAEAIFFAALAAFAVLALYARADAYFAWDLRATLALQGVDAPGFPALMRAASVFGNGANGWLLTALAMLLFFLRRRRTEMFALLLSVGGGAVVNRFVKLAVGRPRPVEQLVRVSGEWARESFPSGHVTFYVCYFGFLFFVAFALLPRGSNARRAALALAALPVLLIGLSRMYLGAHWASDVLGAYLLSGAWLALCVHLYGRWKARSTFHRDEVSAAAAQPAADETPRP
ncbi:MAG TPA: phosphatase PAP2 family protein [Pyrinomonadaceae bacterium]|jgi:undecaprenyl-diphosphatase|nr:phosphatase PAP2 family protein [Pyrinomonadaceae bacterium]